MAAEYDVFVSHAWADGDRPRQIADALEKAGLRVWFDANDVDDFASITRAVTEGLAQSKVLLAYYSKTYPLRRACQWELTAAFVTAQYESDPRRRVLVINPEAHSQHIHPVALRDAKFRGAPTGDDASLRELTQSVISHVATVNGSFADVRPLKSPMWHGTNPVGSTSFVGRLSEMWELHSLLHQRDVAQITGAPAAMGGLGQVSGLGGVGKSLLAEEYALRFGAAYPGGIFWLRAYGNDDAKAALKPDERETERRSQMQSFAERLGIDTRGLSPENIEGALSNKIELRNEPCLWIVDDAPGGLDGQSLRRWFAPHPLARTLVTTRSREYRSLAKSIDLSVLKPEEAYQLITSRKQPFAEAEEEQARLLAKDLGYHALALDVTASALASLVATRPFANFRDRLAEDDNDAMELAESLSDALPNGHERSIAKTFLRSVQQLGEEGKDFLRLASVLAVAPIPASLVAEVFKRADSISERDAEVRASVAFKQVTASALAETVGEHQNARGVHTLVSRTVRFWEKASPERTGALRAAVILALRNEISRAADDPRLHKQIELQVAHARQVVSHLTTTEEARLALWLAQFDLIRGAYASARVLIERARDIYIDLQGLEHPDTLASMNNLAHTLHLQGNWAGARKLNEETLEIRRRMNGSEHPATLLSMNNLANTLYAQGDLAGARKLFEETLEIRRRVDGSKDPATLSSMGNLAVLLGAQGDLAAECKLEEETLEIRRQVLGSEHPDTLIAMNNLASTLHAQGDLENARKLQEQELEITRRMLGLEHPSTSISAWNLFRCLEGEPAQAELRQDLLWLLDRDPATLGADQRRIREYVADRVEKNG